MTTPLDRLGRDGLLQRIAELEKERDEANRQLDAVFDRMGLHETGAPDTRDAAIIACWSSDVARIAALESGAEYAAMLENLGAVQRRCSELLDENRGWRYPCGLSDTSPEALARHDVIAAVITERWRQDAKWGAASTRTGIPDGTGSTTLFDATAYADAAKEACDRAFAEGNGSFLRILAEEFAEVVAESEPAKLRAELVQAAAVCVLWCEVIDLRGSK